MSFLRGVKEFFEKLNENWYTSIISCGINIRAYDVAKNLGIDFVYANSLIIEEGKVVGGKAIVPPENKGKIAEELLRCLKIRKENSICVGDSEFDRPMFEVCGLSIAINSDDEAKSYANYSVNNFYELKNLLSDLGYL